MNKPGTDVSKTDTCGLSENRRVLLMPPSVLEADKAVWTTGCTCPSSYQTVMC